MSSDGVGRFFGLLDRNRTCIARLGGVCTIHYATRRSADILTPCLLCRLERICGPSGGEVCRIIRPFLLLEVACHASSDPL